MAQEGKLQHGGEVDCELLVPSPSIASTISSTWSALSPLNISTPTDYRLFSPGKHVIDQASPFPRKLLPQALAGEKATRGRLRQPACKHDGKRGGERDGKENRARLSTARLSGRNHCGRAHGKCSSLDWR